MSTPPTPEAMLRDLELQWQDHFHMRDQTWKTLTYVSVIFLGLIGLEIKAAGPFIMIPAYVALILSDIFGWAVAAHHRVRQAQKFELIKIYEKALNLYPMKAPTIQPTDKPKGFKRFVGNIFTVRFIEAMHASIGTIATFLLLNSILQIITK